jgi:hypothetical protein
VFSNSGFRLGAGYSALDVATGASGLYLSGAQGALNHLFINPTGNVGIGTASPNAYTGYTTLTLNNATTGTVLDLNVNSTRTGTVFATSTAVTVASVTNIPIDFNSNNTTRMRLDAGGNFLVGTLTNNASGGKLQVGNGITFPATQSTSSDANTLDDYEEGTFTPTIIGTTTAGTATYVTQSGLYTKVGRQVSISIYINYNSGTGTGKLKIAGLPFTSSASNNAGCAVGIFNAITMTANHFPTLFIGSSTTEVTFWSTPVGGGGNAIIDYDAAGEIIISATYFV